MIRRTLFLLALLLVPAQAIAQQPSTFFHGADATDPFQPLMEGRASLRTYLDASLASNAFGVGDLVAIGYLADDFRPSDVLLVAGRVPAGDGLRLGTEDRIGVVLTLPILNHTIGVRLGARAVGEARFPDDVVGLLRDGHVGESLTVDASSLGANALAYAEAGLHVAGSRPVGLLRLHYGLGARYVQALAASGLSGAGEGDGTTRFTVTTEGVDGTLAMSAPLNDEVLIEGSGIAADLMLGVDVGEQLHVRAALTDLGALDAEVGERTLTTLTLDNVSFGDLSTADDDVVTDTLPAEARSYNLPAMARLTARYRLNRRVAFGLQTALPLNDALSTEPALRALAELRPIGALPVRLGVIQTADYGTGFLAGLGVDVSFLRWALELETRGGPALADVRGFTLKNAFALRF